MAIAGRLEIEMVAGIARLQKDMNDAKSIVGSSMKSIEGAVSSAKSALGALGVGLGVGAVVAYTKSIIDAADAMRDLSQRVGIAVQDLAKYELATKQSGTTMEALSKGIKGISTNLAEHGDALKKAGLSATTADGAMRQLADLFQKMPDGLEKTALAVKMFGKSGMDLIPMLNMGSKGLDEAAEKSAKFAAIMAVMAPQADEFNDSLAEIGLYAKIAGMGMMNDALPALNAIAKAMAEAAQKGGMLKGIMAGIGAGFENYKNNVKNFWGIKPTEGGATGSWGETGGASGSWAKPDTAAQDKIIADAKAFAKRLREAMGGDGKADPYIKLQEAAAKFTTTLQKEADQLGMTDRETKLYDANVVALTLHKGKERDAFVKSTTSLIDKVDASKQAVKASEALAKADIEAFKAMDELRLESEKQITTASTLLATIQFETSLLEMNTEQRAIATMERDLERQGIIKGTAAYDDYIVKLKEAMSIKTGKEAGIKAADDLAQANKKAAEDSGKYWEDALMRAFESGKGFFQSLWDTIKNTLKTQVLKVMVQGVMGGLGASGAAMAGASGGTEVLSGLGLASSIFGSSFSAEFGLTMGSFGSTIGLSIVDGIAMMAEGTMAGLASGLGTIAGALGPIAIGIAALVAISKATSGEMRSGGQYSYNPITGVKFAHGPSGGQIAGPEVTKAISGTVDTINKLLTNVGSASRLAGFQAALESSGDNRGGALAGGRLTSGASFGQSGLGSNYDGTRYDPSKGFNLDAKQAVEAFTLELQQSVIEAIQSAPDVPVVIADMVKGVVASTLDAAATADLLKAIDMVTTGVNSFNSAIKDLPFESLKNLSFDAAAGLIVAAGGMDKLGSSLATYYDKFYLAEEKRAQTIASINRVVAEAGVLGFDAATATRDEYRKLVDSQKVMTPAGQKAYAALVSVAGAFDLITPAATSAAISIATLKSSVLGAAEKVYASLRNIGNDVKAFADAASAAQSDLAGARNSISESLWAAQDRVIELQKQAADGLRTFTASIDDFLNTINPSTSSTTSLAALKAQLSTTATLASGGDTGAQSQLIAQAQAVLKAAEASSTDRVQYARSESFVRSTLATVKKAVDPAPIVKAVAVAIVSPLAIAKAELKAAQDAVIAYSLLAQQTGAETDRTTRIAADSVTRLSAAFRTAQMASIDAQNNYSEALRVTEGLTLTVNGSFDSLIADLASLDSANAMLRDSVAELTTALGMPNMPASDLAAYLGLAGTAAKNFIALINGMGTATKVVIPPAAARYSTEQVASYIQDNKIGGNADELARVASAFDVSATQMAAAQALLASGNTSGVTAAHNTYQAAITATPAYETQNLLAATAAGLTQQIQGTGGSMSGAKSYSMTELQSVLASQAALGYTADQLIGAAVSGYGVSEAAIRAVGQSLNLPGYATGSNYIQSDQIAQLHAGETITPRPYVDIERNARADTNALMERLVASNERLEAKVAALQKAAEGTEKNTGHTANSLHTVTRGGRAMQTEAFV